MATFYLIRHGKPDYTYGDTHGFIGQGHDFAPLKKDRIKDYDIDYVDGNIKFFEDYVVIKTNRKDGEI